MDQLTEDSDCLELRRLVEEYMVAVELGQHNKVSNLGPKICFQLVELFDEIHNENVADLNDTCEESFPLSRILSTLCHKLRERNEIASAYSNVVEFIRIRDSVCLSKLLGAISDKNGDVSELVLDFNCLARILRQSIHLLKYINLRGITRSVEKKTWLYKKNLNPSMGIGFPIYMIDFTQALSRVSKHSQFFGIADQLKSIVISNGNTINTLQSDWFYQFLDKTLEKPYPIDRFTILVGIWIIAVECGHVALEQLIGELVDQIVHEETNSCNDEELMQLTQVGSFWLSYHKRYEATLKQVDSCEQADENEQLTDNESSESLLSSSSSIPFSQEQGEKDKVSRRKSSDRQTMELRFKLKRLIDFELLHGVQCVVCDYQPTQLLEPLNEDRCPGCNNGPIERCSISFQPLPLFTLDSLISCRPKLNRLVMISPNEWARQMILLKVSKMMMMTFKATEEEITTERVDICENFERLTVLRGPDSVDRGREGTGGSDSDESSSSDEKQAHVSPRGRSSKAHFKENRVSTNDNGEEDGDGYMATLENYMRTRPKQTNRHVSESINMLKFSKTDCTTLALCSCDMLLMDSLDGSIEVRLVASKNLFASGSLWSCQARSLVSQIMFGCGRLFTSLELVRLGQANLKEFSCPYCECSLTKIRTLYDGLEV